TQSNHIFAAANEQTINVLLKAFFDARSHYLNYGTDMFASSTDAQITHVSTIDIAGIPGGIDYLLNFSVPQIDISPPKTGTLLPPQGNEVTFRLECTITINAITWEFAGSTSG